MRSSPRLSLLLVAAVSFTPTLIAEVLYFGLQDIPIPTDATGIYLNIDTGDTDTVSFIGWDFNVSLGGSSVTNSDTFQPARTGTGSTDPIFAFVEGDTIDDSSNYATGAGSSNAHVGVGAGEFPPDTEAYMGFQFLTDANDGPHYGWARVVFTSNNPGGLIKDWAYETSMTGLVGNPLEAGSILRSPIALGMSTVTLSGSFFQATTLGTLLTDLPGATTNVEKTGDSLWTIAGDHTYTGTTTITSGDLEITTGGKLSGTSSVIINGGSLLLTGDTAQTDRINNAASVELAFGYIDTNGLNESVGPLILSDISVLDLCDGTAPGAFHFAASNGMAWNPASYLIVANWTGSFTGGGTDQLFFGSDQNGLTSSQLDQIFFDIGGDPFAATLLSSGELVPVPEPGAVLASLLLLVLVGWRERRWFARCREARMS